MTIIIPVAIAFGIVLFGSLTSLAGSVPSSNPAYAQNINTRAAPKLFKPSGANGV
ncbi:MAG: hypothetical protein OIN84_06715 [Candidatus Methanoperedens sp.]|nr:hypothetical protein [Candidatus Methanoperedens sp.]